MSRVETFNGVDRWSGGIAARVRSWPPLAVILVVGIAGLLLLTAIMIGIGLLLTSSFLSEPIHHLDADVSRWVEVHRTATLNGWTEIGSNLARTEAILIVAGLSVAIMLLRRLWNEAAFIAAALGIELLTFLAATTVVDRPRPTIEPLDPLPFTSSYPSGHMGAAIVMYVGLAIVISAHVRHTLVRVAVWIVGVLFPVWVGLSRIYRGMHHASDVLASVVMGTAALLISLLAVRSAAWVADRRGRASEDRAAVLSVEEIPA